MKNCPPGQTPETWMKVEDVKPTYHEREIARLREENARLREALGQVKTSFIAHNLNRDGCPFDFGEGYGGTFDMVDEVLS